MLSYKSNISISVGLSYGADEGSEGQYCVQSNTINRKANILYFRPPVAIVSISRNY